ncbi:(2Fe-2S)-binding protein [Paenibacillus psychroresistens]|uniref:(2Fe-2S)-binding protein n=1 Tax=Paenibacillus psychroresistens TaxID=1778678 RepID=A0A6B8RNL4_9BACL|nr:(2Fe-2S)-binding protein [Paenibacillus psychroresistens]QGQ97145.1 (2Fe-2S)-binding protein [Paenibacillus psychroresistens]
MAAAKFQVSSHWEGKVNGTNVAINMAPTKRLLDILREDLGLTGTKVACEMGRCGACMVLVDGQAVNACLTMAYQCSGKEITTIEGLADEELHPIQQAFLDEGGFQCGYCTPGMIISIEALLSDNPQPNRQAVEEGLCGNLCRCTGYGGIVRAVEKLIRNGVVSQ